MSLPLILSCLWVIAGAVVAMLPMRWQLVPGLALLIAAPVLIIWLGMVHGWPMALIGVLALVSMFRKPLGYLLRRLTGQGS